VGIRFVLLDRDGVINQDRPESVRSRNAFVVLPSVPEAIALLNQKGYAVLVVTNQACVGRGQLSREELDAIHRLMSDEVGRAGGQIEQIYVCPHIDQDHCDCRKPKTGLIDQARQECGFQPAETWMVGDDLRDIQAAQAAGCRPALVRTGKGGQVVAPADVPIFWDLMHFAVTIPEVEQAT
jgi:D-glycero-D-manno-heptose 1,7-bisphosphate phosphatase